MHINYTIIQNANECHYFNKYLPSNVYKPVSIAERGIHRWPVNRSYKMKRKFDGWLFNFISKTCKVMGIN